MRPLRLVIVLISFVALVVLTFISLLNSHPRHQVRTETTPATQKSGVQPFFSFHTPTSFFAPSAIISLTDDNSTFFVSKLADYGPALPSEGLSGQLWVGSGFGDDSLRRGGATNGVEGELGCSDVPGWVEGTKQRSGDKAVEIGVKAIGATSSNSAAAAGNGGHLSESDVSSALSRNAEKDTGLLPREDDGTDDHLHHPLPGSQLSKSGQLGQTSPYDAAKDGYSSEHADIQSLQESAEIAGKVVLLSRGGCGFLEKTKWVQRRGGMALIVGDNARGGPLLIMYGRGDTSNITIPSLFTSHTTAHLLSSLIPEGSSDDDDGTVSNQGEPRPRKGAARNKGAKKNKSVADSSSSTPTFGAKVASTPRPSILSTSDNVLSSNVASSSLNSKSKGGWLRSIASTLGLTGSTSSFGLPADSRRPPSSGRIDWVISDNWADEPSSAQQSKKNLKNAGKTNGKDKAPDKAAAHQDSGDNFVIGVQDWRDPDLVATPDSKVSISEEKTTKAPDRATSTVASSGQETKADAKANKGLLGGSTTPGSGEYEQLGDGSDPRKSAQTGKNFENPSTGWMGKIFRGSTGPDAVEADGIKKSSKSSDEEWEIVEEVEYDLSGEHDGLWVTMTPTTMSTSPFFDTLLVLVVSPLITLTVVYALLLLRSRIRRRRWRAPKSVVDRLPVRTYHTMSCTSNATSLEASPMSSSPTSPLLQSSARSISSTRPRPRSRTTSHIVDTASASLEKATAKAALGKGVPPAKKRYTGKQVECVVCLEEYVDGQSRVMSLPCGHEFHAECITPWLTTRRRTCPICKGDVVRSMNQASATSSSTAVNQSYHNLPSSDEIQREAAETINDSPSSAIPIPRSPDLADDLERGDDDLAATLVNDQPGNSFSPRRGWRGLASLSLSAFSGEVAFRQAQADRNR